jgi:hypothetical protein
MKYFPLTSLLSLLLVMPACNWNWRGRCARSCAQPCATSCTQPCTAPCPETCSTSCSEIVTEVPLTYSAPLVPTQDGQVYTQRPEPITAYQEAYKDEQDFNLDHASHQQARQAYDMSDMK